MTEVDYPLLLEQTLKQLKKKCDQIEEYHKWLVEETENHYSEFGAVGGMIENELYKRSLKKFDQTFATNCVEKTGE